MSFEVQTDVLIVGGGLSGLSLAKQLFEHQISFHLVEARDRFGGRIKTEHCQGGYFDLGPAWFWAGQPRILSLIEELGLKVFDQYASGKLTYEDERGTVQHGVGYSSMEGSMRLEGGLTKLTDALADGLPAEMLSTRSEVTKIQQTSNGIRATVLHNGLEITADAKKVVLCNPPRVAAQLIEFEPALSLQTFKAMENVSTWMAGQAKALAIYEKPFWRNSGLSGDAMSGIGPMVEVHDASPRDGGPFALFGFIGVPAPARSDAVALEEAVLHQFGRLFGEEAMKPKELIIKDWAFDRFTATKLDQAPVYNHPQYGLPSSMTDLFDGNLMFGSTETAPTFGGYLEGALEASENVVSTIVGHQRKLLDEASFAN